MAVLFSDNLLAVFDLAVRTAIFKAKFNDATDNISQLFFVAPRFLEAPLNAPQPATPLSSETTFMSFFLMVETKLV